MLMRTQIGFYKNQKQKLSEFDALIYRHSDECSDSKCYISYNLLPFLKEYHQGWGLSHVHHAAARTLQHLCNLYDDHLASATSIDRFRVFGISKSIRNDINFFYAIYGTGLLKVFEVDMDMEKHSNFERKLTLIYEFDLTE